MEYDINQLLEFTKSNIKLFDEKYEMFLAKPDDLIGKKVISIRSGFSNSGGGQVMVVSELKYFGEHLNIILMPCEESRSIGNRENHGGWSCRANEKHQSFVFYKPELRKIIELL